MPARRFYLDGVNAAAVSPVFNAGWTDTTQATRTVLQEGSTTRAYGNRGCQDATGSPSDTLRVQYVSDTLAEGIDLVASETIIRAVGLVQWSTVDARTACATMCAVRIANGAGVIQAEIVDLAPVGSASVPTSAATRRYVFNATSAITRTIAVGERLVFEVGFRWTGPDGADVGLYQDGVNSAQADCEYIDGETWSMAGEEKNAWLELGSNPAAAAAASGDPGFERLHHRRRRS